MTIVSMGIDGVWRLAENVPRMGVRGLWVKRERILRDCVKRLAENIVITGRIAGTLLPELSHAFLGNLLRNVARWMA